MLKFATTKETDTALFGGNCGVGGNLISCFMDYSSTI